MNRSAVAISALCLVGLAAGGANASIITVANPSFETHGSVLAGGNWAFMNPGSSWTVPGDSQFSVNSGDNKTAQDGSWSVFLGNTGTISQDLLTSVSSGDTLSITFFGGRAKSSSSVNQGGVGIVTFSVAGTDYSTNFDTTVLANDAWQSYTFTQTIANSGDLVLKFGKQTGANQNPFLDNVGNVSVSSVPEPASLLLFGLGSVALLGRARRRPSCPK